MFFFRIIARLFGYVIIKKKKLPHDVHTYVVNLLNQLSVNCVVDVGANKGQYAKALRDNGYTGHIFSFEPVKENYMTLEKNACKDPKWHTFCFALGSKDAKGSINIMNKTEFSSFLRPSALFEDIFKDQVSINANEAVTIKTLDSMHDEIFRIANEPRIYLKMDTQGYDLEVLKGASAFINKVLAMQSEVSVLPLYDGMPDYLEALATFRSYGFAASGFFPVAIDPNSHAIIEFDCTMVRV